MCKKNLKTSRSETFFLKREAHQNLGALQDLIALDVRLCVNALLPHPLYRTEVVLDELLLFINLLSSSFFYIIHSGDQLSEACSIFLPVRLEDTLQSRSSPLQYAAVRVGISLSQRSD